MSVYGGRERGETRHVIDSKRSLKKAGQSALSLVHRCHSSPRVASVLVSGSLFPSLNHPCPNAILRLHQLTFLSPRCLPRLLPSTSLPFPP